MKYYVNTFLIYSFVGFLIETTMKYLFNPGINNGSLRGPWIPIYGLGACIIIFIMRLVFNRFKVSRPIKIILVFLISTITLSILELIGGYLMQMLTGKVFWDYSNFKFHIGHYIALEISLIWGILSMVLIYLVKPFMDKFIKKIPSIVTYLVFGVFLIDLITGIFSML